MFRENPVVAKYTWHSERAMDNSFRKLKEGDSGVYLIVLGNYNTNKHEIVYVGASWNLKYRAKNHELVKFLRIEYKGTAYIPYMVYSLIKEKYALKQALKKREVNLIKAVQPKFNIQHK